MEQQTEQEMKFKRARLNELTGELNPEDLGEYTSFKVNWVEGKQWESVKNTCKNTINNIHRLVFMAHSNDIIEGKPQLIYQTMQRIPLIRTVQKTIKEKGMPTKILFKTLFLDDHFDKRYDGEQIGLLALDFWLYRVISNGKEYYVLSESEINLEYSKLYGMEVIVDDTAEMSNTLKVKSLSSIFILKESKPHVKIVSQNELVEISKDAGLNFGWTYEGFKDFIFTNPDGNIYDYTEDFNMLRIAQLLSGKYEGYPLHLMKVGPVGTGKTTEAETLDSKFKEQQGILEAGTSRMKVLTPSFKEKPANLGYICNCNRVAIIDELMKMISETINKVHTYSSSDCYLGEMNMLLEQKRRTIGSGNDNNLTVQSTAKVNITTNPLQGKNNISSHVGIIDPTTLSRMLIWIQDNEESTKIYLKKGIRVSPHTYTRGIVGNIHNLSLLRDSVGGSGNEGYLNTFLTIYDSCQVFICKFDKEKIKEIFNKSVNLAKEPMKQVWRSRGLHHISLLIDGICKYRCLFKDYDSTFTPIEKDYLDTEKIIDHMIKTWDTNFDRDSWKEEAKFK